MAHSIDTTRLSRAKVSHRHWAIASLVMVLALASPSLADTFDGKRSARIDEIRKTLHSRAPDADNADLARALGAMASVPREDFVPPEYRKYSYDAVSLPIGYEQTISDMYAVALMTAVAGVDRGANVLDIGTGSGYQAAVLDRLGARVTSIEIVEPLAALARERLRRLGYSNVEVRAGDGYAGAPDRAPFDAIIVAAGTNVIPPALLEQLKPGGRLVMPLGASWASELLVVVTKKADGSIDTCSMGWVMFVPLTGKGERAPSAGGVIDRSVKSCFSAAVIEPIFVRSLPKPTKARPGRR